MSRSYRAFKTRLKAMNRDGAYIPREKPSMRLFRKYRHIHQKEWK